MISRDDLLLRDIVPASGDACLDPLNIDYRVLCRHKIELVSITPVVCFFEQFDFIL